MNLAREIITYTLVTAVIILLATNMLSAQGRGRGRSNGPPDTPPGQGRKITVPEPATLTLLGIGLGAGLVARRLKSRRTKPGE